MLPRDSRIAFAATSARVARLLAVGMIDAQHDQPRVDSRRARPAPDCGSGWMRRKSPVLRRSARSRAVELVHDLVGIALELLGAILGQLGDRRLGGVPVARAVLVEVGGGAGEPAQRIAEDGGRFAGHHAAELDAPVLEAAVGGGGGGRRAEVDGARHTAAWRQTCPGWALRRRCASGSELGPSTSFSMTGTQLSER